MIVLWPLSMLSPVFYSRLISFKIKQKYKSFWQDHKHKLEQAKLGVWFHLMQTQWCVFQIGVRCKSAIEVNIYTHSCSFLYFWYFCYCFHSKNKTTFFCCWFLSATWIGVNISYVAFTYMKKMKMIKHF